MFGIFVFKVPPVPLLKSKRWRSKNSPRHSFPFPQVNADELEDVTAKYCAGEPQWPPAFLHKVSIRTTMFACFFAIFLFVCGEASQCV